MIKTFLKFNSKNMYNRTLQFLSICYRYNNHHNSERRVYISVIGDNNAIIIYKQLINNRYVIKGFETGLKQSEVINTIIEFYKNVPLYPEIITFDFNNFSEFLSSSYKEIREPYYII